MEGEIKIVKVLDFLKTIIWFFLIIYIRKLKETEKGFKQLNRIHTQLIDDFEGLSGENKKLKSFYEPMRLDNLKSKYTFLNFIFIIFKVCRRAA